MNRVLSRSLAVAVAAIVLADWMSKLWIANRMALGETLSLVDGWLYFVHRKNPGVAFSMLADLPDQWRVPLLSLASLVGVVLFTRIILTSHDPFVRGAASLVIAGAVANLGDRVVNGHVTDFVLVRFFPFVFNVADAAITVGGILLAIRLAFEEAAPEPAPVTAAEQP
jgi:signal peptidase II